MTIDYQGGALLINVPALRVTIEVATPFQFRTPTLPPQKILENPIVNMFSFWLQNMNPCVIIHLHA